MQAASCLLDLYPQLFFREGDVRVDGPGAQFTTSWKIKGCLAASGYQCSQEHEERIPRIRSLGISQQVMALSTMRSEPLSLPATASRAQNAHLVSTSEGAGAIVQHGLSLTDDRGSQQRQRAVFSPLDGDLPPSSAGRQLMILKNTSYRKHIALYEAVQKGLILLDRSPNHPVDTLVASRISIFPAFSLRGTEPLRIAYNLCHLFPESSPDRSFSSIISAAPRRTSAIALWN